MEPCTDCGHLVTTTDGRCSDCLRVSAEALELARAAWLDLQLDPAYAVATAVVESNGDLIGYIVLGTDADGTPIATANVVWNDDETLTVDDYDHTA